MLSTTDRPRADHEPAGTPAPPPGRTAFGSAFSLGTWFGIPVRAHWSVLVTLGLFTALIAAFDLPASHPGSSTSAYWLDGVVGAVVLMVTLLVHEVAHALVARHYGVKVRQLTVWMLGGLTELTEEPPTPRADAAIAAAGPLASLGTGALLAGTAWLTRSTGLPAATLAWLAGMNVVIGLFNLLPGAPLDGGRLLRAALWARTHDRRRAATQAAHAGRRVGQVLVAVGLIELVMGAYVGLWSALLGWFILAGAESERRARQGEGLHGVQARAAMTPTPVVAPAWWTVETFIGSLTPEAARQPVYPLVDLDGRFAGLLSPPALARLPSDRAADVRLRELAVPPDRLTQIEPDDDIAALVTPQHWQSGTIVVVEDGRPVGVVTAADIARMLQLAGIGWTGGPHST
ncbi:site-2 protease family protein [Nocardioides sp. AN3]